MLELLNEFAPHETIMLNPILNENTRQYFVSEEQIQPWSHDYGDSLLPRKEHLLNFFKVGVDIPLREVLYLGENGWGVNDRIDLSHLYIGKLAFKVTKSGIEYFVEDTLWPHPSAAAYPHSSEPYSKRVTNLSINNAIPMFFTTLTGHLFDIFNKTDRVSVELSFEYTDIDNMITYKRHSSSCTNKDIQVELIGFTLDIPYINTDRLRPQIG